MHVDRHLVIFSGRKYDTLPSHINTTSRLYEQIVERMQDAESPLSKMALAVTDASHPCTSPPEKKWNGKANRFDEPERGPDAEDESYGAVVYPDRVSLPFPITQESVENRILEGFLHGLPSRSIAEKIEDKTTTELVTRTSPEIDVYVCVSKCISRHRRKAEQSLIRTAHRHTVLETVDAAILDQHFTMLSSSKRKDAG